MLGFGLVGEGSRLGFLVIERREGGQASAQFWKADRRHRGASRFLLHRACVELRDAGCVALNMRQDLGLPGQARAKHALRPRWMLRKFAIAPAAPLAPTGDDPARRDKRRAVVESEAAPREPAAKPVAVLR